MAKHTVYQSRNSDKPIKHLEEKYLSKEVIKLMSENALLALYERDSQTVAEDVFGNVFFDAIKEGENGKG